MSKEPPPSNQPGEEQKDANQSEDDYFMAASPSQEERQQEFLSTTDEENTSYSDAEADADVDVNADADVSADVDAGVDWDIGSDIDPDTDSENQTDLEISGDTDYQSEPGPEYREPNAQSTMEAPDIELVDDIPVLLTLEVGDRQMTIAEIMELRPGSIVALQHRESDPLDVKVNGVLVARGEVVLTGDNYGVRILSLTSAESSQQKLL